MSTTYSSQGKTAERVLALMSEKTTNKEAFYVAVSRAKHGLRLYATDKYALIRQAQVSRAKENASDYMTLSAKAGKRKSVELEVSVGKEQSERLDKIAVALANDGRRKEQQKPESDKPERWQSLSHGKSSPKKSIPPQKGQLSKPASTPNRYAQLWQKYSAGVSARNPVEFDYRVGRKAVLDGCDPKTVTLMVVAGSEMVRQIRERKGKQQAIEYARKTAIAASRERQSNSRQNVNVRKRNMELDD